MVRCEGYRLLRFRRKLGLTQAEFAEVMGYKSYYFVCKMERDRTPVPKAVGQVVNLGLAMLDLGLPPEQVISLIEIGNDP